MFGDRFACSPDRSATNFKQNKKRHSRAQQDNGQLICSRVARPPWKMFGDGFACSPHDSAANLALYSSSLHALLKLRWKLKKLKAQNDNFSPVKDLEVTIT